MAQPRSAFEIFQLLDKSNCRECGEKTCLAFAGAVFTGQRKLRECPRLDPETIERFTGERDERREDEPDALGSLGKLRSEVASLDLAEAAERVGARFSRGRLTLKVLGKDFSVDKEGNLSAEIHINPWVAVPFLDYILHGEGVPASGRWVPFRELAGGRERYPLFQKRCEEPMKRVADTHTDLFDYMVHVFSARQVDKQFESDISVVLHPLPRVPLMICYWLPEDGLASSLHVFFDETADRNLDIGSVFSLGTGLAQMFGKIALRHGFEGKAIPR
ncbi:MAG: DUF3786 domain-containing protein [Deltaproteobacteria bacterium]|nr:DUF3786 domain-containing protein [Deltaproteobacteria bacterium]